MGNYVWTSSLGSRKKGTCDQILGKYALWGSTNLAVTQAM